MVTDGQIADCFELYDFAEAINSSCDVGKGAGLEVCGGSTCAVACPAGQQKKNASSHEGAAFGDERRMHVLPVALTGVLLSMKLQGSTASTLPQ